VWWLAVLAAVFLVAVYFVLRVADCVLLAQLRVIYKFLIISFLSKLLPFVSRGWTLRY
jgi:hypothetical protein